MAMRRKELISVKAPTHWICDSKYGTLGMDTEKKMTITIILRRGRKINYWLIYRLKRQLPQ